ncbi:ABC transporter permease [Microbacterium sp. Root166]|uniref:MFS transporter n=1 Tax=Microbacterium sp. Root166 TaxID=1736478 RepID=UPI0007020879|nr:MFS transporter [Microbacterium sp. Root166]KQZ85704.1 ABC transporter permease [Microbacterium sp. Root166]
MSSTPRPLWQGRALALVGIVLFAFSLRTAVASLSPVVGYVDADFALPAAVVGLIGTAPPVCYALFGILTPRFERRFGLERLALAAMVVAVIGLGWRGLATGAPTLVLSTALIFAAVGVGNILLPPLVKKYFPDRIGLMTTIYSTTLAFSTLIPPLVAVPVADAAGWRLSLGMWAVFAAAAIVPWLLLIARPRVAASDEAIAAPAPQAFRRMWRLPLAWALVVAFSVSGVLAYTAFAWLPLLLEDVAGVSPATAGALLSLFAAVGLPASLLVPLLVVRFHATRALFGVAVVAGLIGIAGLLFAPQTATWLWVVLLGTAPLLFPLTLVLLGLRTRTPETAVALSAFVQSLGYAVVALFPLGIGLIHGWTDSWTVPLVILAVVVIAAAPAGVVAARRHTVEDDWEQRHGAW